ncbi:MAG: hypothetical protein QM772_07045 [Ottowia sp.]|uniref:hypothetical protein n=1 Tax=Ottowia sp. TaxID=1898956 RepID=UPI0039E5CC59
MDRNEATSRPSSNRLTRPRPCNEAQAPQELKALLLTRLADGERNEVSALSAVEIAEEVIRETGAA